MAALDTVSRACSEHICRGEGRGLGNGGLRVGHLGSRGEADDGVHLLRRPIALARPFVFPTCKGHCHQ